MAADAFNLVAAIGTIRSYEEDSIDTIFGAGALPDIGDVNADGFLLETITDMDDSNYGYFPAAEDFIAALHDVGHGAIILADAIETVAAAADNQPPTNDAGAETTTLTVDTSTYEEDIDMEAYDIFVDIEDGPLTTKTPPTRQPSPAS